MHSSAMSIPASCPKDRWDQLCPLLQMPCSLPKPWRLIFLKEKEQLLGKQPHSLPSVTSRVPISPPSAVLVQWEGQQLCATLPSALGCTWQGAQRVPRPILDKYSQGLNGRHTPFLLGSAVHPLLSSRGSLETKGLSSFAKLMEKTVMPYQYHWLVHIFSNESFSFCEKQIPARKPKTNPSNHTG